MRLGKDYWQETRRTQTGIARLNPTYKTEIYGSLEIQTWEDDLIHLRVYRGKSGKPTAYYYYASIESRQKAINECKLCEDNRKTSKIELDESKKIENTVKTGDIFYSSWGYDQTNIDYYEVVSVKKSMIEIRELKQNTEETGFMSGRTVPVPGNYKSEPMIKRVQGYKNKDGTQRLHLKITSFSWAWPWDGHPKSNSWYA